MRSFATGTSVGCGVTFLVAACSLVVDTNGLTGEATEAGAPPAEAAADSGMEVAPGDSATNADALRDARARFCDDGGHAFCADFDAVDFMTGWTDQTLQNGGQLERLLAPRLSAPFALSASTSRRETANGRATMNKQFNGDFRPVVVDFDVYAEAADWKVGDLDAALVSLELLSTNGFTGRFYLLLGPGYLTMSTPTGDVSGKALPVDRWVHVHMDVDAGGAAAAKVDTVDYFKAQAPITAGTAPTTNLGIGINGYKAPNPALKIHYDNVVVDFR